MKNNFLKIVFIISTLNINLFLSQNPINTVINGCTDIIFTSKKTNISYHFQIDIKTYFLIPIDINNDNLNYHGLNGIINPKSDKIIKNTFDYFYIYDRSSNEKSNYIFRYDNHFSTGKFISLIRCYLKLKGRK